MRHTRPFRFIGLVAALWLTPAPGFSHFLVLIPDEDLVDSAETAAIGLEISFMHPFEGKRMDMAPVKKAGVLKEGQIISLPGDPQVEKQGSNRFYRIAYHIRRPGDHIFFVDSQPYWEPAEQSFIAQQAKVVVNAFGLQQGWDQAIGLKAEIIPLARPYSLWAGSLFTGKVLYKGEPVPFANIEATLFHGAETLGDIPEPQKIQLIKADQNGIFSCAMPRAGWWGFAALLEDDQTLPGPGGKSYPVELGAVIWVKAHAIK